MTITSPHKDSTWLSDSPLEPSNGTLLTIERYILVLWIGLLSYNQAQAFVDHVLQFCRLLLPLVPLESIPSIPSQSYWFLYDP